MKNVIFVAPYFMDATERFIAAASNVPDTRLGLVSCDPVQKLAPELQQKLDGHYQVENIDSSQLLQGVEKIGQHFGGIDRILGMLEQIQVPLGEIRDHLNVHGMGAEAADNFRDKAKMKTVLRNNGIPCARHCLINDLESGLEFGRQTGFPLIIKPPAGAGAKGTYRSENEGHLIECLNAVRPSQDNPTLIEEFIVGEEFSFDSVCVNGKMVWHSISHYSPGPLEVVREPWIQWCVMIPREVDSPEYEQINQIAPAALSALGMDTGLSHMEWFKRPDGSIAVSEVGARPPGAQFTSLMSYAHDFDMYTGWADTLIHDRFNVPDRKYSVGAAYLRGMGSGKVSSIKGIEDVAAKFGEIAVEVKIPQIGQHPSGSYEGEGYIIVRHPETSVVANALKEIVSNIRVELSNAT